MIPTVNEVNDRLKEYALKKKDVSESKNVKDWILDETHGKNKNRNRFRNIEYYFRNINFQIKDNGVSDV